MSGGDYIDRAALRALAEAATPGPWAAYFTSHGDPLVVEKDRGWFAAVTDPVTGEDDARLGIVARVSTAPADYGRANCEYIGAVGPDVVLALLDRIAELEARLVGSRNDAGRSLVDSIAYALCALDESDEAADCGVDNQSEWVARQLIADGHVTVGSRNDAEQAVLDATFEADEAFRRYQPIRDSGLTTITRELVETGDAFTQAERRRQEACDAYVAWRRAVASSSLPSPGGET